MLRKNFVHKNLKLISQDVNMNQVMLKHTFFTSPFRIVIMLRLRVTTQSSFSKFSRVTHHEGHILFQVGSGSNGFLTMFW